MRCSVALTLRTLITQCFIEGRDVGWNNDTVRVFVGSLLNAGSWIVPVLRDIKKEKERAPRNKRWVEERLSGDGKRSTRGVACRLPMHADFPCSFSSVSSTTVVCVLLCVKMQCGA